MTPQQKTDDLIAWLRAYAPERIDSRLMDERRCLFPHVILDFGNRGLLGMQIEEEHGGLGLPTAQAMRVLAQLGAIDLTVATFTANNNGGGILPIRMHASEERRAELLPQLATGRMLASFSLTEAAAGSNPRAIEAKAAPRGDGWSITGEKIWVGAAGWAGVINVFAHALDDKGRTRGLTGFLLRPGGEGVSLGPEAMTFGVRSMLQCDLSLRDAPAEAADVLGRVGSGMDVAQEAIAFTRLGFGAMCQGGMMRCAQLLTRWAGRRNVASGRLLDNPSALLKLSEITAAATAVRCAVDRLARALDVGEAVPPELVSSVKIAGSELLWKTADDLIQLLGGRGYMEPNQAPQILRDARVFRIAEGPTEALHMYVGSSVCRGTPELFHYLREELGAPRVADRLRETADRLRARSTTPGSAFKDPPTAMRRAHLAAGELLPWALLQAASEASARESGDGEERRAARWAAQRFDEEAARLSAGGAAESVLLSSADLEAATAAYEEYVGVVDPRRAGEQNAVDPILFGEPSTTEGA